MNKLEQRLQEQYAIWLRSQKVLFCASLGGRRTSIGVAVQMKRAGYMAGYPDIIIEEPRNAWHGMRVELKVGQSPSPEQKVWQRELLLRGIYAVIMPSNLNYQEAWDWLEEETNKYLRGEISRWPNK